MATLEEAFGAVRDKLNKRVRVDVAQTLTGPERTQARDNMGLGTAATAAATAFATAAQGAKADSAVQPAGLPTWSTISDKPAVVAAGADDAEARSKLGVATSYSNNLLDPRDYTPFSTITAGTGALASNASHHVTKFIPVKPSTYYTSSQLVRVAEYAANQAFIKSNNGSEADGSTLTFQTSPTTAYVRAVMHEGYINGVGIYVNQALQEGMGKTSPVDKWWTPRPDLEVYTPAKVKVAARAKRPVLDMAVANDFVAPTALPARSSTAPTPAELYAAWDVLVTAYPAEVTRTEIVAATKNGNKVYRYDITPARPAGSSVYPATYPKVLVTAGLHGGEFASMWNLVDTLTRIFAGWATNPHLEMLRWNVNWRIIPLANPDGLVLGSRKNANGVDIARNFPAQWAPGAPADVTYGGAAPLDQPEAVAIWNMLRANTDAHMFLDHHNYSSTTDPRYAWMAVANDYTSTIAQAHCAAQTRLWKKSRPTLDQSPTVFFADSTGFAPVGSPALQAATDGVPASLTYECSQNIHPEASYGTTNQTMAHEGLVNFLTLALRELSR